MDATQAKTCTLTDERTMRCTIACIEQLQRETVEACPEWKASDWQFEAVLTDRYGIPWHRIRRLVELGMLESKPSDGHGTQVKVNPEWRRCL